MTRADYERMAADHRKTVFGFIVRLLLMIALFFGWMAFGATVMLPPLRELFIDELESELLFEIIAYAVLLLPMHIALRKFQKPLVAWTDYFVIRRTWRPKPQPEAADAMAYRLRERLQRAGCTLALDPTPGFQLAAEPPRRKVLGRSADRILIAVRAQLSFAEFAELAQTVKDLLRQSLRLRLWVVLVVDGADPALLDHLDYAIPTAGTRRQFALFNAEDGTWHFKLPGGDFREGLPDSYSIRDADLLYGTILGVDPKTVWPRKRKGPGSL